MSESRLVLYVCDSCGAVSTKNFRDDCCRVCRVAMEVSEVVISASVEWGPAPHVEDEETLINTTPPDPEKVPGPICQHCDAELPVVGFFQWAQGVFMMLCVYCPHCRRTLSTQVIPNLELMAQPEDPRIHIPH